MFCTDCGTEATKDEAFCKGCGTPVKISHIVKGSRLGNFIMKGSGKDGNADKSSYVMLAATCIVLVIASFFFLGAISDDHVVGLTRQGAQRVQGIIFFSWVMPTNTARVMVAGLIIAGISWATLKTIVPKLNSEISVFEHGISGTSTKRETFELTYDEVSSVDSQEIEKAHYININSGSKVYQVYTPKWKEIIAEIKTRRRNN
ncbi:MAG: hypothetical protein FWG38_08665 [Defluviitaleaceae bacterium]|nr:hypothetical protein [Defluviitaleaceae bacterium]